MYLIKTADFQGAYFRGIFQGHISGAYFRGIFKGHI
jgi:hypothetical protein